MFPYVHVCSDQGIYVYGYAHVYIAHTCPPSWAPTGPPMGAGAYRTKIYRCSHRCHPRDPREESGPDPAPERPPGAWRGVASHVGACHGVLRRVAAWRGACRCVSGACRGVAGACRRVLGPYVVVRSVLLRVITCYHAWLHFVTCSRTFLRVLARSCASSRAIACHCTPLCVTACCVLWGHMMLSHVVHYCVLLCVIVCYST